MLLTIDLLIGLRAEIVQRRVSHARRRYGAQYVLDTAHMCGVQDILYTIWSSGMRDTWDTRQNCLVWRGGNAGGIRTLGAVVCSSSPPPVGLITALLVTSFVTRSLIRVPPGPKTESCWPSFSQDLVAWTGCQLDRDVYGEYTATDRMRQETQKQSPPI